MPDVDRLGGQRPAFVARARETFEIEPDDLVVAGMDESLLHVDAGTPSAARAHEQEAWLLALVVGDRPPI